MPTLRLVYLTEQQYAGMTDHAHGAANNTTAEQQLPSIDQQKQSRLVPIADATRNALSYKPPAVGEEKKMEEHSDHEEDKNDYLDTLLQEASSIDAAVNSRSFGGHALRHQQVPHEEMVSSSDEEIENDSSSPVHLDAIQQTSGNKRKRTAPKQSFDDRFNDLMAFRAKYCHCDVPCTGENASLGAWCSRVRESYKKIQKHQKPTKIKLSDEQIERLNDAGFKWSLRKANSCFAERFNDLMAFKAKYGHCDVSTCGEDASLGLWCSVLRGSYKKMQNNQKPHTKLAHAQIQCLTDAGFKWSLKVGSDFDKRFNDLMAFKAKCGHCHVPFTGQNASLGQWCSEMRVSYKKIQNNQKPINKLSDEQIQRLNDAGFKWSLQALKRRLVFDKHFNDLMSFKAKYGHCDVPQRGENASFGKWCNLLRVSYKKIQNNQTPNMKLSDEQIQRLNDLGFKWCR
jgi:hypothetical protein